MNHQDLLWPKMRLLLKRNIKNRWTQERILALSILGLCLGAWNAVAADGPPVILTQPASQTVLQSYPAVFGVGLDGTPPFLFQWLRNGALIASATNSSYTVAATGPLDNGAVFSVLVTNDLGNATSSNAVLRLDPGTLATNTIHLVGLTDPWVYDGSGINRGTVWRAPGYDDSSWSSGAGLLYIGDNPLPAPKNTLLPGTPGALPTTYYFRTHFTHTNKTSGVGIVSFRLLANTVIDDGAVFYLNGTEGLRLGLPLTGISFGTLANRTVTNASLEGPFNFAVSNLLQGDNVLAVEVHQVNATNDDLAMGLMLDLAVTVRIPDTSPPVVVDQIPAAGATVNQLTQIEVFFNEPVEGVDAADLLINGTPASSMDFGLPGQFVFYFSQPATGLVQIAWDPNHGIHDLAVTPNDFAGGGWTYTLDLSAPPPAVSINEFMASNKNSIHDEDGASSDWIELYNADIGPVSLNGWYLTDDATNLTKWRFPNVVLEGNGPKDTNSYLVVFASGKDRTNVPGQLHTSFQLNKGGAYLALVDPQTNIVSDFNPSFPAQVTDVSYGRDIADPTILGYFPAPTPGRQNSTSGSGFAPDVQFSQPSGTFVTNAPFYLTLSTPVSNAVIYYVRGTNAVSGNIVPGTNSFLYSNPILITNTTLVRARAFVPGLFPGTVQSESFIALSTQTNIVNFVTDLPILILHNFGGGAVPSGSDQFVVLQTFEPEDGLASMLSAPSLAEHGTFHLRGSSTLGYAKGSFALKTLEELGASKSVPFLGLPDESSWVLYAPNNFEPVLMHNPLAHQLAWDSGQYSSRTRFVEVFLKDDTGLPGPVTAADYNGIYVLEEKIKIGKNRVDIDQLQPENTHLPEVSGGYIFSIDRTAPNEQQLVAGGTGMNWIDPHYSTMTNAARAPQVAYISGYFNAFNTALNGANWTNSASGYAAYINIDSWINNHVHEVITYNVDALRLSGYFHKPRNEKLNYGPAWDYDRTQGSTDGRDFDPRKWTDGSSTDFFNFTPWWARLFHDPDFWQKWIDRYQQLRTTGPLTLTNIYGHIDHFANVVRMAQPREQAKWSILPRLANGTGVGTYDTEVQWEKNWYSNRLDFIDKQLLQPPFLSSSGGQVPSGFAVTLSPPAEPGSSVLFTLDGTDPRLPGGSVSPAAFSNNAPVTLVLTNNVRLFVRARNPGHLNSTGSLNPPISSPWSGPTVATLFTALPPLRITEIMYNPPSPPPGDTNNADNFEYIELKNTGATPLNLNNFQLSGGISFLFPNLVLGPQQSVVVVKDVAAFQSRYGTGLLIAGAYSGNLGNGGDHLVLQGSLQEPILDFDYQDAWYPATDGLGFSLVIVDENASPSTWGLKSSWRPSSAVSGSPGQDDPSPPARPGVVVNEALSHEDPPAVDAIELYNPTDSPVDLSGWFLSDTFGTPKKFVIPPNTVVPSGGLVVFYSTNSFGTNSLINFGLGARGDQVYLFSGDGTNLTGYVHGFDFGAAEKEVSFGRYVSSTGHEHFVAQSANTLGGSNAYPKVGPVVVSEIMYHPPDIKVGVNHANDTHDEYIELQNASDNPVPLFDVNYSTNTWRLRGGVDYDFPAAVTIPAPGFVLVVGFDPADPVTLAGFRARNGVAESVPVYGPFQGQLNNGGDNIELSKPDAPELPPSLNAVAYILVDKVDYSDGPPWPLPADGFGASLQRVSLTGFGNDPTNWVAAVRTPGAPYGGGVPPTITSQPASQTTVAEQSAAFSISADGTGPLSYQWYFNGDQIIAATNATLSLTNVQPLNAGPYEVFVFNTAGFVASSNATLAVLLPVSILAQPQAVNVRLTNMTAVVTTNITFSVTATGDLPISYQWRFNGIDIPGATTSTYRLTSASVSNYGTFQVLLSDSSKSVLSAPANLNPLVTPVIGQPLPLQPLTLLQGDSVSYTVSVVGFPPPFSYSWRRGSLSLTNFSISSTNGTLTLFNLQPGNSGLYRVVITNLASISTAVPANSTNSLTVLADSDGDRIPDFWETLYGLNPHDPSDATADADGDGMTNLQEYLAGTDPTNALSYLKIDSLSSGVGPTSLQLSALSNKTYSLQYKESVSAGRWTRFADVASRPSNHVETVLDPFPASSARIYRLATPQLADPTNVGPAILTSPQPVRAAVGDNASFNVFAVGVGPLSYQWLFNSNNLNGATTSNLLRNNAQFLDAGAYAVVVSDQQGSQTSDSGVLALKPMITSQPQNQSVTAGGTATFNVGALGASSLQYRWRHNRMTMVGATNAQLTLENVQSADAGNYSVTVTHLTPLGTLGVLSSNAVLTVSPP